MARAHTETGYYAHDCAKSYKSDHHAMAFNARQTPRHAFQQGFSTLEAIVAVALIAVTFLPLLALQSQLIQTSISITRAEDTVVAMKSAAALLRVSNPMLRPEGTARVGNADMVWRAEALTPETPVLDVGGGQSRFVARMYRVKARLVFENGSEKEFEIDLMGWRAIRAASALN